MPSKNTMGVMPGGKTSSGIVTPSNSSSGGVVTFVAGSSSALTANTPYYYEIMDGSRRMVGEFRTRH